LTSKSALRLPGVKKIIRLAQTSSTQNVARAQALAGADDGTLIWAKWQTAGKGRLGRRWRSPLGGLYLSWLIRPKFPLERLPEFSLLCGAAVAKALMDLGCKHTLVKPPNDVLARTADGPWLKISGILCESSSTHSQLDWLIVGIGININNDPPLKRATSLKRLTGQKKELVTVLKLVMKNLSRMRRTHSFS
jgi:BirA family biotin operon repressor/biotin-[acetyl-CoA-carboxylase] ligase